MTLSSDAVDAFAQQTHRCITELMRSADRDNPTVEEINRLFFLSLFCGDQARDLDRAAKRRIRRFQELHGETPPPYETKL